MIVYKHPKKRGGYRTIWYPDKEMKHFKSLLPRLERICEKKLMDCVHGFRPLRNPVTNARAHVGFRCTISMDLEDFFDSVTVEHLAQHLHRNWLTEYQLGGILAEGRPRQGLPTSPLACNLAAADMDQHITRFAVGRSTWYTRYADDLTISVNHMDFVADILRCLPEIIAQHGFKINPRKTRVQDGNKGRRIITGVAVDNDGVYPTRRTKRKLRAAQHYISTGRDPKPDGRKRRHKNYAKRSARGLIEWMKLKVPVFGRRHRRLKRQALAELEKKECST